MAKEPLTTSVDLTKEMIVFLQEALHHEITHRSDDEPDETQYNVMTRLYYALEKFGYCTQCMTSYVLYWSTDKHTCPVEEEE